MKYKQLIGNVKVADVLAQLSWLYPNTSDNIDEYESMLNNLRSMPMMYTTNKYLLCIELRGHNLIDVYARCTDLGDAYDHKYSIGYYPWNRWLGMDVDLSCLNRFDAVDFVAHCLYGMTRHGMSEKDIQAKHSDKNK